ncbi:hypothetical protein CARUB_v10024979mg [Capsella rubella]|uniref:DUF4371 domain-containing protein n=1 Tax=Capsella rubella TaxID=81985 RepID=R0HXD1_9BRAS|nr:hypothetical protein CARUB_v10024979mg [Capsella rubella]
MKRKSPSPVDIDLDDLPHDPSERKAILEYHPNQRDEVRRKNIGNTLRRFNPNWFDQFGDRLEYSVKTEKAYCFFHNIAKKKCEDLVRQGQSIKHALHKQTNVMKDDYRLSFRGHDETMDSSNRGIFLELVKYSAEQNEAVNKVVLKNAPGNNQNEEVIHSILQEIDDDVFALLFFCFVDKHGIVKERFVGLIHVKETCSLSLKSGIDSLFAKYRLSMRKLRGQGYNGAANMRGELNGLRTLISRESSSTYYIHCFAHQLQLVVVAVAKKHCEVGDFFDKVSVLVNVLIASCKRKDIMREIQRVLDYVEDEGIENVQRSQANGLLKYVHTFDYVFYLHLMLLLLGLTKNFSMALQRKDQNIINAISLVESTKQELQKLRDSGWDSFVEKVLNFFEKHNTEILNMDEDFIDQRKPHKKTGITNLHHYQLQEFNDRFNEVNSELLVCTAALNPIDSFHEFDKRKLLRLAEFYPKDFSRMECISHEQQLDIYIDNVRSDEMFAKKQLSHPLVYRLLKLALILPVATATIERCFSGMKIVKTVLSNLIGNQF